MEINRKVQKLSLAPPGGNDVTESPRVLRGNGVDPS